jgi:hypothetical protein
LLNGLGIGRQRQTVEVLISTRDVVGFESGLGAAALAPAAPVVRHLILVWQSGGRRLAVARSNGATFLWSLSAVETVLADIPGFAWIVWTVRR